MAFYNKFTLNHCEDFYLSQFMCDIIITVLFYPPARSVNTADLLNGIDPKASLDSWTHWYKKYLNS